MPNKVNTQIAKNKDQLAHERGKRVKIARTLANLTRKSLMDRYNINVNTVQAWENGINCLTEKGAKKLVEAFQNEGLVISRDWLLHGDIDLHDTSQVNTINEYLGLREDLKLLQEIDFFKKIHPAGVSALVTDDALEPIFNVGDYVAGINVDGKKIDQLEGEFAIITTDNGSLITRKILSKIRYSEFLVCSINPFSKHAIPFTEKVIITKAAQITRQWHSSRILKTF
jgi:DNA-binding transcriptional regulator YiaG